MSSKSLLDTDTMSELLKGKNAAVAARSRDYLRQHHLLTLTSLSVTEVIAGYRQA